MADFGFAAAGAGQRSESFVFTLIEGSTGRVKRQLHPLRGGAPTITQQDGKIITRTLSLPLAVEDAARIETGDRVEVSMIVRGRTWPLGRFLQVSDVRQDYADHVADPSSIRTLAAVELQDATAIINTEMETGFVSRLEPADEAVRRLMAPLGIDVVLEASNLEISNSWTIGETRTAVLEVLAEFGGYLPPWVDVDGALRLVRTFDPADRVPDFDFDADLSVVRETITRSNSLLLAPNRFVIVGNAGVTYDGQGNELEAPPIVAICDVPSTAPHSIQNLGFARPQVLEEQVTSQAQAQALADTRCLTQGVVETVEVETALDPRHEAWDVVRFEGRNWLQPSWAMVLVAGGGMRHSLQRVYPATPQVLDTIIATGGGA